MEEKFLVVLHYCVEEGGGVKDFAPNQCCDVAVLGRWTSDLQRYSQVRCDAPRCSAVRKNKKCRCVVWCGALPIGVVAPTPRGLGMCWAYVGKGAGQNFFCEPLIECNTLYDCKPPIFTNFVLIVYAMNIL